ncbi:LOW QUALITY PROTEIN: hypothetical protein CVT25_012676 [Psilocybe cyanescens]|uniref:Dol-P-Man:Man(5)GlcNAc(2)-PP-Dol alpha-1,3-mannosyltransferase n=1 Tax=Psilocybe cyanescens TaxID=93625 RepID=A0A409VN37_PSICY|nr:LOW QUALITY PROTEIN: hypothetical protein CVT25_012676 [Psilocybe cyanescens]
MSSSTPSIFSQCLHIPQSLLFNPKYFWHLATLVIVGDALLTGLIIQYVPCSLTHWNRSRELMWLSGTSDTEIDWETYMIQTKVFLQGQYNYSLITGPTGPLVFVFFWSFYQSFCWESRYPAGHVRIHHFLYDITDMGRNVQLAQKIYGFLYLTTLVLSCGIYRSAGNIPNWILLLLPLSKRLHSIFVLRLFNDCWSVVAIQASILAFQNGFFDTGIMLFSAALSIKMSILLYLPGLLVILFKRKGLLSTLGYLSALVVTQVFFAVPFLREDPMAYAHSAFDLGRVFMYKWTVNWRFLEEKTFLSSQLAVALLVGQATVLVAFGLFKWCEPDGGVYGVLSRSMRRPSSPAGLVPVTSDYIATVLFTSNLIGIVFARSLHYQFYSWYAQQLPLLAWRTRIPVPLKLALILGIEYAWNVFPSTSFSSGTLMICNVLLLAGVWSGYSTGR